MQPPPAGSRRPDPDEAEAPNSWINPLVSAADEPVPPGARVVSFGSRRVVVLRESHPGRWSYFGHVALELAQAFAYARLIGASIAILPPRGFVHPAYLEVECDGVPIVRSRVALPVLRACSARFELGGFRRSAAAVRKKAAQDLRAYVRGHDLPKPVRSRVRAVGDRLDRKRRSREEPDQGPYWRRRLISVPVGTRLSPAAERRAAEWAASLGIPPDRPIVTVHARERGYKLSSDGRDTYNGKAAYGGMDEATRNSWVETYFPAMDHLAERGYTVVRIGDSTMTPVDRPGAIDLATAPDRGALLDLYCLFHSRFLLTGESSPHSVCHLTNTPLLTVNATDPIGAYPPRRDGILMMKTVVDRETGRTLTLDDLLSEEYQTFKRHPGRYEYLQNTPEEILAAVQEMLDLLDRDTPESAGQSRYRELLTRAYDSTRHVHYVAKFAPDRGFLGYGRIARSQVDPWDEGAAGRAPVRLGAETP